MNQVNTQDTLHNENPEEGAELERLVQLIAHGFEADPEHIRPCLQPFVRSFQGCRTVLDIGCGEGLMLELLHNAGITPSVGIDTDPAKVAIARSKGLEAKLADAHEYLRHHQKTFDGLFLRHIIEHFEGPDAVRLLYLCRKALQPGGIIVVITPNFRIPLVAGQNFWLDITHKRPYPLPLLQHMFTRLGINILEYGMREKEALRDLFIIGQVPK